MLVEVSEATVRYDREVKVPLYARCGVPEVWIVDLQGARFHFYRRAVGGSYSDASSSAQSGITSVNGLPGVGVDLSGLLRP